MALTPSPKVSPPVMRWSVLGLISWPSHLLFEVSLPVTGRFEPGLILWPSHPLSEVSPPVILRRFVLGLISWPTHLLSEVSPLVVERFHPPSSGMTPMALRFSTTMWTMGEIIATDHIERESCSTLITIFHLIFYVWSLCAFHHRT
jgi:hypothetical protein